MLHAHWMFTIPLYRCQNHPSLHVTCFILFPSHFSHKPCLYNHIVWMTVLYLLESRPPGNSSKITIPADWFLPTTVKNTPISSTVLQNTFLHPIINATWNLCDATIIKIAHFLFIHIRDNNSVGHVINKWNIWCAQTCWKGKRPQHKKCHK